MSMAVRNRMIKKVLETAFGHGKVTVRGSRGTAYGWVTVRINHAPRNNRETRELRSLVSSLIASADIKIGTYGYDDPGSDYGYDSTININFADCRETADYYGDGAWRHNLSAEDWDALKVSEMEMAS